jgi:hypothetical protein
MTAAEIAAELRALADRYLEIADILVGQVNGETLTREAEEFYAPFGYKADGTPRLRRATNLKKAAT